MTTVVAYVHQGTVYMAADSRSNVYERPIDGIRKICRLAVGDGEILLGVCGDGALRGLIDAHLKVDALPDPDSQTDAQQWADTVAQAITQIALDNQCTDGGQMDGSILLGAAGRVWTVTHMHAIPHHDGVAAVGSGEGIAIGVMDTLRRLGIGERQALEAVVQAVQTAINRDRHTGGNVMVERLPAPGAGQTTPGGTDDHHG